MSERFTIDGSDALETCLARLCAEVLGAVRRLIPVHKLEALVLGGGYGRGEGGVLRTESSESPYNDLEFYLFLRGPRWWSEHRYDDALGALGARLSAAAGLQVEFKCDSFHSLRRRPVSMFSYDLVRKHRLLYGNEGLFYGCTHHWEAGSLPLSEATRLLLNRCTGLLLARELLRQGALGAEDADFVGRNLAKAELALGDAVLTACGRYHWSCRERHQRLLRLAPALWEPPLASLRHSLLQHHAAAVEFKLHPRKILKPAAEFEPTWRELSDLAAQLWLWLENRRLESCYASLDAYCASRANKFPDTPLWRNYLLNVRTFGLRGALGLMGGRYPRERLFKALPLLLWAPEPPGNPRALRLLQQQLQTASSRWPDLVAAYKRIWPSYA